MHVANVVCNHKKHSETSTEIIGWYAEWRFTNLFWKYSRLDKGTQFSIKDNDMVPVQLKSTNGKNIF